MAPLVPTDSPAIPGAIAPVPRLPHGPSAAPATTGVLAGRPTSRAVAASRARRPVVGRIGASCSARTPHVAIASVLQLRVAMSSSPVPDADDRSVVSVPVSHARTTSFSPTHQHAADSSSGSWRANHMSFVSGVIGCPGTPVWSRSAAARPERCSAASSWARESAQVSRGVSGRRSASRAIRPCMPALTEIAATSAGAGRADAFRERRATREQDPVPAGPQPPAAAGTRGPPRAATACRSRTRRP
jgi:hypothetical protein